MTLSDVAIRRPILTWMMTLALIVFGLLGYNRLGVDQYPNMEFPVLTVVAVLPGSSPESIESSVVDVLEEQIHTLSGVRKVTSTSYQGAAQIAVEFGLGSDLDFMAQELRDVIGRVRGELPPDLEPPTVMSFNANDMPVLWFPVQSTLSTAKVTDFVERQLSPMIETIPGVAGLQMFGARDRAIRIWLDGEALRSRGLSASDVIDALHRQHVDTPGGKVESGKMEYSVRTDAEFDNLDELRSLFIAQVGDAPIWLRDVARVEDGAADIEMVGHYNGEKTVGLGVMRKSGENTVAIVDEVYRRLPHIMATLPEGMKIVDPDGWVDFSLGVREAVEETQFALMFGALLAVFVVFVFLRRTSPTLIVAAAIPISLIATFGLVWAAGYTLNTMTLLGMTLAVGVVIDDAIVVLENIERHRDEGASPREAASSGTRQIAFAATAATFSVAAVFLPVVFVEGIVGSFLGEFGLTVAGSVMISLFVALTLTPMLAARMAPPAKRAHGSIYHRLEMGFSRLEAGYRRLLGWTLSHRLATVGGALASFVLALGIGSQLEGEFMPPTDGGIFMANIEALPGTSLDATVEYLERDERWMLEQPELAAMFSSAGGGGGPDRVSLSHKAMIFGMLVSARERERSVFDLIESARAELGEIPGRDLRIFSMGETISTERGDFRFEVRADLPLAELASLADRFIDELDTRPGYVDLDQSLKLGLPELRVVPDRKKAAALGVDARTIATAIQAMVGGMDIGVFKEGGRRYDIRIRLEEKDRADPAALGRLYVRNDRGRLVELRNVVRLETGAAPSAITRSDRLRAVTISGNLSGKALGTAIGEIREIAASILPEGATLALTGNAESMQEGMQELGLALGLAVLVIYMVLAAQFESLVHPLTVMLALPLAMVGALLGLFVTANTLNLFSMIGILLLFGLVTKNSILVVDYANQLREAGMDKLEAIRTAAPVRMRPVLMTALSMVFGVLPAAIGFGPGSESRAPMAIATAAGMLSSTVLTLIVVPVFYVLFDDAADAVKRFFGRAKPGTDAAATVDDPVAG